MRQCPRCKSADIHSSRTRSKWEQWRKEITGKRPYRCRACGWRGWGFDVGGTTYDPADVELATQAIAPDPPNLKGTALAVEPRRADELNLNVLDVLAQKSHDKKTD